MSTAQNLSRQGNAKERTRGSRVNRTRLRKGGGGQGCHAPCEKEGENPVYKLARCKSRSKELGVVLVRSSIDPGSKQQGRTKMPIRVGKQRPQKELLEFLLGLQKPFEKNLRGLET